MSVSNVYNMDCMEALKEFPDGYFELCIADPPYGINVTGRHKAKDGNTPLIGGAVELSAVTGGYGRGRPAPFAIGGVETAALKGESKSSKSSLRFILCSMIAPHRTQTHSGS